MTTTRYAIELEKGKWMAEGAMLWMTPNFQLAEFMDQHRAKRIIDCNHHDYPHARIVPVKCEVVDE